MGKLPVALSALALVSLLGGCDALSGAGAADDEASEDGDSKKKKKKKPKKGRTLEDAEDGKEGGEEDIDVSAVFGEQASFGGSFDMFGGQFFGATSHSPVEPDNFSMGWVGRESFDVLQRARDKEFRHSQVRMASGRICLVFKEGNTVRRAMIATRRDAPTEELAFAANGNLILWYRHNRKQQSFEDWAYFHRGNNLMLYQTRSRGGDRLAEQSSPELRSHILRGARECVQASSAGNPLPGAAPAPAPAPAPPPATPGGGNAAKPSAAGLHFGAIAYSPSAAAWRVSYRKGTEQEAKDEVLSACTQADCAVKMTFTQGQCISVVHGPPPYVAWGKADDNNTAQTATIDQCVKDGHSAASCQTQGTWCNDG